MSQGAPPGPAGHTTALPPGYVLDSYRIERMLGEGGFGITYLGVDTEIGKRVAIKELLPKEFATRTHGSQVAPHGTHTAEAFAWSLDSFMNEARTLAGLSHGNVVQIHRLFRANGTAYMVMDYVDGWSLKDWLKSLSQPPDEATLRGILMPLLEGLEHVHKAGLLHRDIKPDNIFLTTTGKPVLLDFGSARVAPEGTQTMTSLVSKGYSPFELYATRSRQTPAVDLYALAATMVRAVTGKAPEDAADRIVDPTLTRPMSETHRGRYSEAFLRAIDAAFAVQAAERPQSVAAWREMLEGGVGPAVKTAVRTGVRPSAAAPQRGDGRESSFGFSRKPSGRGKRGWLPAAVASLLSVAAGVVAYLMLNHGGEKEQGSEAETSPAVVSAPAAAPKPVPAPVPVKEEPPTPVVSPAAPVTPLPVQPQPADVPAPPKAHPADLVPVPLAEEHKAGDTMEVALPGGVKMTFCWCPPGEFLMGSPASEAGRSSDEDQVNVKITKGYWLARTEVTQEQWEAVMGSNPSYFKGAKLPVENVSWEDAQAFIEKLNGRGGLPAGWKWALPSEAQWEHACRAGARTAFSFGDTLTSEEANFDGGYPYGTEREGPYLRRSMEVGSYRANGWGLQDMHGNVWEWCLDGWDGVSKLPGGSDPVGVTSIGCVERGGSWYGNGRSCRSAFRNWSDPGLRSYYLGFRLAAVPAER